MNSMPLPEIIKQPSVEYDTFGTKPTQEQSQRGDQLVKWVRWILFALVALVALVLIIINRQAFVDLFLSIFTPAQQTPELVEVAEIPVEEANNLFLTGKLTPLWEDLGYFSNLNPEASVKYYQAGIYRRGQHQGATRIVATLKRTPDWRSENFTFLATPDGRVFFDGGSPDWESLVENLDTYYLWQEIRSGEGSASAIVWLDEIPNDHPQVIELSPTLQLYRRRPLVVDGPYTRSGALAAEGIATNLLALGYEPLANFTQNYPYLSFWAKPYSSQELLSELDGSFSADQQAQLANYLAGGSEIVAVDQIGLAYVYSLTFKNKIEEFLPKREQMLSLVATYKSQVQQWALNPGQELPAGFGWALSYPGFKFGVEEFYFPKEMPGTKLPSYATAMIDTCSGLINAKVVKNLGLDDLTAVGVIDIPQTPLYRLSDTQHPLLRLAYELKIERAAIQSEDLIAANSELYMDLAGYDQYRRDQIASGRATIELPSFEQYAATWPLLFFQDSWGRWLMVGESSLVYKAECQ